MIGTLRDVGYTGYTKLGDEVEAVDELREGSYKNCESFLLFCFGCGSCKFTCKKLYLLHVCLLPYASESLSIN